MLLLAIHGSKNQAMEKIMLSCSMMFVHILSLNAIENYDQLDLLCCGHTMSAIFS